MHNRIAISPIIDLALLTPLDSPHAILTNAELLVVSQLHFNASLGDAADRCWTRGERVFLACAKVDDLEASVADDDTTGTGRDVLG